jgi:hypothetical protein
LRDVGREVLAEVVDDGSQLGVEVRHGQARRRQRAPARSPAARADRGARAPRRGGRPSGASSPVAWRARPRRARTAQSRSAGAARSGWRARPPGGRGRRSRPATNDAATTTRRTTTAATQRTGRGFRASAFMAER